MAAHDAIDDVTDDAGVPDQARGGRRSRTSSAPPRREHADEIVALDAAAYVT